MHFRNIESGNHESRIIEFRKQESRKGICEIDYKLSCVPAFLILGEGE